mgnify:CR=1 FL=1
MGKKYTVYSKTKGEDWHSIVFDITKLYSDQKVDVKEIKSEGSKIDISRYKGLGEMNADQLWDTTMSPENRTLLKVTINDAVEANRIFSKLMGEEVEGRREFIQSNAQFVVNLDI